MKNILELSHSLLFRDIKKEDLNDIDSIWNKYYKHLHLPNLDNTIGDGVIKVNGRLVAFGLIKLRPECLIFLEKDQSERMKVACLLRLQIEAIKAAKLHKYNELIAGIDDVGYSELLDKQFGFKKQPGMLMRLEL